MDKPHKKLDVWKLSMDLADAVYRLTASFPPEEKLGPISQLRRAAVNGFADPRKSGGMNHRRGFA